MIRSLKQINYKKKQKQDSQETPRLKDALETATNCSSWNLIWILLIIKKKNWRKNIYEIVGEIDWI